MGSEHLAERYRQFLIVALGDMILVTASTFSVAGLTANRWAAFASAFVTTVLLWRIYIYRAGELLGHAIAASEQPVRVNQAHLLRAPGDGHRHRAHHGRQRTDHRAPVRQAAA